MKKAISIFMAVILVIILFPRIEVKATEEKVINQNNNEEKLKENEGNTLGTKSDKSLQAVALDKVKLTIMNYDKPDEVVSRVEINIGNNVYKGDSNGEVTIPISDMSQEKAIVISYLDYDNSRYFIYKAPSNVYTEDAVISVKKDELIERDIKQQSENESLFLGKAGIIIRSNKGEFTSKGATLDEKGKLTLISNISNIIIFVDPYSTRYSLTILKAVYPTNLVDDIIIDNVNVGRLVYDPNLYGDLRISNEEGKNLGYLDYRASVPHVTYLAAGQYDYTFNYSGDYKNKHMGTINIESNKDTRFKHDTNFKSSITVTKTTGYPQNTLKLFYSVTDSLGNKIEKEDSTKYIEYYENDKYIGYEYGVGLNNSNGTILSPNIANSNYTIKVVDYLYGNKIISNSIDLSGNRKFLDVTTPTGEKIISGTIDLTVKGFSNVKKYNIINGEISLPKNNEDYTVTNLQGITVSGVEVYTKNFDINREDKIVKDKDLQLFNFNSQSESLNGNVINSDINIYSNSINKNLKVNSYNKSSKIWLKANGEEYKISALVENESGYYQANKIFKATLNFTDIALEKSTGNKVEFYNKADNSSKIDNIIIKNSKGVELKINNNINNKPIYLEQDNYLLSFNASMGVLGVRGYTKEINTNLENTKITIGETIDYKVNLSMLDNKSMQLTFTDIKIDGVALNNVNNVPLSKDAKVYLMHGNKTLLQLNSTYIDKLKGKCSISIEDNKPGAGDIIIDKAIVNFINNDSSTKPEDINLDGEIDIFDLVTVSTSLGTVPGDSMWDYRVNLYNSDVLIDVLDLASVASKYNNISHS